MRCPFCGSPDVTEETEERYESYDTRLVIEGVYKATPPLPYYFCNYCSSHFRVVSVSFSPVQEGGVVFGNGSVAIQCPSCKARLVYEISTLAETHICDYCGKEFNLVEDIQ